MDAVHAVLRRLRDWFLVWFVAEAAAGTAVAAYVLEGMGRHGPLRHVTGGIGVSSTIFAGLIVSLGLFLIARIVLEALVGLRPWARMVMLVIGWITVVSAAIDLLALPGLSAVLASLVALTDGYWPALVAVSALTKTADLVFWSWVIYTLQLNPAVRHAFIGVRSQTQCLP